MADINLLLLPKEYCHTVEICPTIEEVTAFETRSTQAVNILVPSAHLDSFVLRPQPYLRPGTHSESIESAASPKYVLHRSSLKLNICNIG
jgi:hypothetical protein